MSTSDSKQDKENRVIIVNGMQVTSFPSNMISTTKYTWLTFVPRFLFSQFQNYTNCFFLMIIVIQQFPGVSPIGKYTTLFPFIIMMSISAVKEILEDYKRFQQNKIINFKEVEMLSNGAWVKISWKDVQVGNIVKVNSDNFFPADLLLIASSNEDGICYIETVNLDGETNLKVRRGLPQLLKLRIPRDLTTFATMIICDPPNELIYSFSGSIKINTDEELPLHSDQLLLRDAILRNTSWIVGVVIYTGHDTKVMNNSSRTPVKRSTVSSIMNFHIIILFLIFLASTISNSLFVFFWNKNSIKSKWYLDIKNEDIAESSLIYSFLTFVILYSFMIPISLQVCQEMARYFQVIFMNNDIDMYFEETNTWAAVRTSNLNEDLGMVNYIFSDKTGTLTQNKLEFKGCVIEGVVYNESRFPSLRSITESASFSNTMNHFFTCLCICNTVIPAVDPVTKNRTYFASSPDERALIIGTSTFGYTLYSRTRSHVRLGVRDKIIEFEILAENEFTSARRRSSIVVRDSDGKVYLYIMGADDAIVNRLSKQSKHVSATLEAVEHFASYGYRTLCIGMKELKLPFFKSWYRAYKNAQFALTQKQAKLTKLADEIEKEVLLLGATAVEDKLQDQVPETISLLLQAGINIWMLTGDKLETAVNIGHSTQLLKSEMPLVILSSSKLCDLVKIIRAHSKTLGDQLGKPGNNLALVVNGNSLQRLFSSKYDEDFIMLAVSCKSVICCRCTPLQKARIIENVRHKTKSVTLAIGDGANDVAMIQKATIGVGISGFEGLQAAQSADYSIGQFKYLQKLLLVHGAWNYTRICLLIYMCYYKNFLLIVVQFYYAIFCGWSGQIIFDRWSIVFYNVLFTSGPVLTMGIFEKNFSSSSLMKFPSLYLLNNWFNNKYFLLCLLNAFWHGILLMSVCLAIMRSEVLWSNGHSSSYLIEGNTICIIIIIVLCGKFLLHMKHWTIFTAICICVSIFSWLAVMIFLSFTYPLLPIGENMSNMIILMITSPIVVLTILIVPTVVLLIDWLFITLWRTLSDPLKKSELLLKEVEISKKETSPGTEEPSNIPKRIILQPYSSSSVIHNCCELESDIPSSNSSQSESSREVVFYFMNNLNEDSNSEVIDEQNECTV